jgi:hypothetical protein
MVLICWKDRAMWLQNMVVGFKMPHSVYTQLLNIITHLLSVLRASCCIYCYCTLSHPSHFLWILIRNSSSKM